MKKRILIATSLLVILIIGSISVYATSFESNIDIMEKVGQEAEKRMYEDKAEYYKKTGIERRGADKKG